MPSLVETNAFFPPNPPSYQRSDVDYIWRMPDGTTESRLESQFDSEATYPVGSHDLRIIPYVLYRTSAQNNPHNITVIYTHGNAEDLGQMMLWLQTLSNRLNVHVLGYDYEGYGYNGTPGNCTELGCYRDIEIVYQWVTQVAQIPADRIILFGRSIGTGATVHFAAQLCRESLHRSKRNKQFPIRPLGGVILQSPLLSAVSVVSWWLSWLPLLDIFMSYNKIASICVPTMIIHGMKDRVIPFNHGEQLYQKLLEAGHRDVQDSTHAWIVEAGHNDIESIHGEDLIRSIRFFMNDISKANGSGVPFSGSRWPITQERYSRGPRGPVGLTGVPAEVPDEISEESCTRGRSTRKCKPKTCSTCSSGHC